MWDLLSNVFTIAAMYIFKEINLYWGWKLSGQT